MDGINGSKRDVGNYWVYLIKVTVCSISNIDDQLTDKT